MVITKKKTWKAKDQLAQKEATAASRTSRPGGQVIEYQKRLTSATERTRLPAKAPHGMRYIVEGMKKLEMAAQKSRLDVFLDSKAFCPETSCVTALIAKV
ncbi:unnamed protein product [Caenorhabditis auriculariae]|uniref:Uncharacterized protein n=1 Tax=Caenorhabditis auriculariae TaxID=2777116 RepID=A0A8S1H1M1_9PELO|nr:unnamed protein product [Caenorhabditis auriculariae]